MLFSNFISMARLKLIGNFTKKEKSYSYTIVENMSVH